MLFLIGLGLNEGDITQRSIYALKTMDEVYLERYTAPITDKYLERVTASAGKQIKELSRGDLEEKVKDFVALAKDKKIALLVPGDPMIATTHSIILNEAAKIGVKSKILHAPSIFSAAISESGLDVYRFGPTVTIPYWHDNYQPTSFIDTISKNLSNNEHTIMLCDINAKEKRSMKIEEAVEIISKAEAKTGKNQVQASDVIAIGGLGSDKETIIYQKLSDLIAHKERFAGLPITLILPANPTFAEKESLSRIGS